MTAAAPSADISQVLKQYWGFDQLRPLQERAIRAAVAGRDSLVVMPTGGGKSLCYQIPPLITGKLAVVISPLIALMKDQVDGLRMVGYPAGALHSGMTMEESSTVLGDLHAGELKLLFVSPERLLTPGTLDRLARLGVASFSVDEGHCISQWGHDFRPEYRRLREVKARFPNASYHAFTATATPRVRQDIIDQLELREPEVLVGIFDRPNLTYRVQPKLDQYTQVEEVARRHKDAAVIVYCLSRKDTEHMAATLKDRKLSAEAYHAGMTPERRRWVQDEFAKERLSVVCATIAFGMGIDRSNVRAVVHASMPKSIEHYQQETGRAGRDGLEAECVMLYSSGDAAKWMDIIGRSAEPSDESPGASPEWVAHQQMKIEEVRRFASGTKCRHRFLSEYFGQQYIGPMEAADGCGGCDVCLGEFDAVPESTVVAQKILSCVARLVLSTSQNGTPGYGFGAAHVINVLRGGNLAALRERGHDKLSTFGILREFRPEELSSFISQLVDEDLLRRADGKFPTLTLTPESMDVLKRGRKVILVKPRSPDLESEAAAIEEPFDAGTFEMLRKLRMEIAQERNVPAYIIFGDAVLRDLARRRPTQVHSLRQIRGVGEKKAEELGPRFVAAIYGHCAKNNLTMNVSAPAPTRADVYQRAKRPTPPRPGGSKVETYNRFEEGKTIAQVTEEYGLAPSTIASHLAEFIEYKKPGSIRAWMSDERYESILEAATKLGSARFRPIFDYFEGKVSYDEIRVAAAHARNQERWPRDADVPTAG